MTDEQRAKRRSIWRKYYVANRAKMLDRVKAYRLDNSERVSATGKAYRENHAEKLRAAQAQYREQHRADARAKAKASRLSSRDARREADKAYRKANPEQIRETKRAYVSRHLERVRACRRDYNQRNKEINALKHLEWARANPGIVNALTMKRYAAKNRAMPSWADQSAIRAFYIEAARITKESGARHEVDHIVPLQNDRVCGLHVAHNLRVLTKTENRRKWNRLPDEVSC